MTVGFHTLFAGARSGPNSPGIKVVIWTLEPTSDSIVSSQKLAGQNRRRLEASNFGKTNRYIKKASPKRGHFGAPLTRHASREGGAPFGV